MKPYEKENNDGERKQPMKKVISLMLALVLALSLTACGGKSSGPEGVVDQFCKGLQKLDEKALPSALKTATIWNCRIWRTWTATMPWPRRSWTS